MQSYRLYNLNKWILAGSKLLLSIHYFACCWILIYNTESHISFVDESSNFSIYFESVYMVTSTITTVGYGDYKAFNDTSGNWQTEQIFLSVVILFGIILFTLITNEIFTYQKLETV